MESYDGFLKSVQSEIDEPQKNRIEDIRIAEDLHQTARDIIQSMLKEYHLTGTIDVKNAHNIIKKIVLFAQQKPYLIASVIRFKQDQNYLCNHIINTCMLSIAIAVKMKLTIREIVEVGLTAAFCDLAMINIPSEILDKDGELSPEEIKTIQMHVTEIYEALKQQNINLSDEILNSVLQHHERKDGSGYPRHLNGKQITRAAQIIATADIYDAMTSSQRHKSSTVHTTAIKKLYQLSNESLSKFIVKQLVSLLGVYPVSTIVRLTSGELAIIFDINPYDLFLPKVLIFSDQDGISIIPRLAELSKSGDNSIKEVLDEQDYDVEPHAVITAYIAMQT